MSKFLDSQGVTDLTKQYDERYAKQDIIAPKYDTTATYNVGDVVIHNGGLYQCILKISTAEAWTPAHWNQVAVDVNDVVVVTSTGVQSDAIVNKLKTANFVNYRGTLSGLSVNVLLPLTYESSQSRSFHLDIFATASDSSACIQYNASYNIASKAFYINRYDKAFVLSFAGMNGIITASDSFISQSSTLSLSGKLPYRTTAPTADNTSGFITIVVLDAEPATRYNGYLYIITASAA